MKKEEEAKKAKKTKKTKNIQKGYKTGKVVKIISILLFALLIALLVYSIVNYEGLKNLSKTLMISYGLPVVFLLSLFFDIFPQYLSAHMLILMAGIAQLNVLTIGLVVTVGTFFASIIGFWLGRFLEKDFFMYLFGDKNFKKIERGMNRDGKWYVAISAVSPLPYIPIVFAALGMSWKNFMIYGVVPRIIGFIVTIIFVTIVF
jgi:uncharacterized membrane protein YdjX (TVP38/TMEM64 family)